MDIKQTRGALYLLCIARAGYREGGLLIEFIEEWRRCVEAHGGPVTIEEFIDWTDRYQRRTTFRRIELFRESFPQLGEHGLPDGLMAPLVERLAAEVEVT
jgi:hypothetical protein